MSLGNITKLLPEQGNQEHPPIFLKLNTDVMELLETAVRERREEALDISVAVSDRNATLRVKDLEFAGTYAREPGFVQVYLPKLSSKEFRSAGKIHSRIALKSEKPTSHVPVVTESKIVQLLASKAHTASELATKTQTSASVVQQVLSKAASPSRSLNRGEAYYSLKPEFYPPNRNAKRDGNSKDDAMSGSKEVVTKDATRDSKRDTRRMQIIERSTAEKRKSTSAVDPSKRTKSEKEDMYELARKFQEQYGEYRELYQRLSDRSKRSPAQVQRLMMMHLQLGQWKKTLWSNAQSKSEVN